MMFPYYDYPSFMITIIYSLDCFLGNLKNEKMVKTMVSRRFPLNQSNHVSRRNLRSPGAFDRKGPHSWGAVESTERFGWDGFRGWISWELKKNGSWMDRHGIKKQDNSQWYWIPWKKWWLCFHRWCFFRVRSDLGIYMSPSGSQRVVNWVSQPHDS